MQPKFSALFEENSRFTYWGTSNPSNTGVHDTKKTYLPHFCDSYLNVFYVNNDIL